MTIQNYEVITTLGPSSDAEPVWESLLTAGATGFRVNTSHLSLPQLYGWLEKLHSFLVPNDLTLVLDLQGSKWRLGNFIHFELVENDIVTLILADTTNQPNSLPVSHTDFFKAAVRLASEPSLANYSSNEILLNDAKIILQMETASKDRVIAKVKRGGIISPNKGITFAASGIRQETLSAKDQKIVEMTQSLQYIRYAISYIKDAIEMEKYRSLLGRSVFLIAKLERQSALDDAIRIADFADELWLCRGDLGAELGLIDMAKEVYNFSVRVPTIPKPLLMAGQVLEHMTEHTTPTRSEICFLYETLIRGYTGVVLSDETAIGKNPVLSCQAAALFKTR